ncbi:hypothetical protein RLOC_00006486 [Lonchura striata]|uniref:Uncharacterized protein n=1 Tax=Lonchura striata TaxID=40157 RepID=A0A218USF4_9PASE|nr:hypothetical protein RLOC_00006486 [Lonchura striata domestica]
MTAFHSFRGHRSQLCPGGSFSSSPTFQRSVGSPGQGTNAVTFKQKARAGAGMEGQEGSHGLLTGAHRSSSAGEVQSCGVTKENEKLSAGYGTCGAGHRFGGGAKSSGPVLATGSPQGC